MNCKDCGQPIHWSRPGVGFYHDTPDATLACPSPGMIEPARTDGFPNDAYDEAEV